MGKSFSTRAATISSLGLSPPRPAEQAAHERDDEDEGEGVVAVQVTHAEKDQGEDRHEDDQRPPMDREHKERGRDGERERARLPVRQTCERARRGLRRRRAPRRDARRGDRGWAGVAVRVTITAPRLG